MTHDRAAKKGERRDWRDIAYKLYDKVMELENGEGGCSLYDYCLTLDTSPDAERGAITTDSSKVDHLLAPIIELLRTEFAATQSPQELVSLVAKWKLAANTPVASIDKGFARGFDYAARMCADELEAALTRGAVG